MKVSEQVWID